MLGRVDEWVGVGIDANVDVSGGYVFCLCGIWPKQKAVGYRRGTYSGKNGYIRVWLIIYHHKNNSNAREATLVPGKQLSHTSVTTCGLSSARRSGLHTYMHTHIPTLLQKQKQGRQGESCRVPIPYKRFDLLRYIALANE